MMQRMTLYLLALVFAICAAYGPPELPASLGCSIPFAITNATLDAITVIGSPTTGSPDPFTWNNQGGLKAWPSNYKNNVLVSFCYMKETIRGLTADKVFAGAKLWRDALGGSPSTNTGYGIDMVEACELFSCMNCMEHTH
jgi:hypothetical protein